MTMRMRTALLLNYSCLINVDPTSSQPRVVCFSTKLVNVKGSADSDSDTGTDTEDMESFMSNLVSLWYRSLVQRSGTRLLNKITKAPA